MNKIFLLAILMGAVCTVHSQTISIKDKASKKPLEMVTLASTEPNAYVTTNADGKADISRLKGAKKIEIRLLGYQSQRHNYTELKNKSFLIYLEQSEFNLDQVVISATRWNQSEADVPTKITSIKAEDVAFQNPQTAADLLSTSGEVYVQKSQMGGGSPIIRGFSTNRLLLVVDGVRMNNAIFRSGNLQNVISLDPFAMQSTEVLFGPGSVIYGSDAIGGVMSFRTLKPIHSKDDSLLLKTNVASRYSTANNEKTFHFDLNLGKKKWAGISSFSISDYEDLKMGSNGPDEYLRTFYVKKMDSMDVAVKNEDPEIQKPTAYSQINLMQKLLYKPNENWGFDYGFHYSTTTDNPRFDRLIRLRNNEARSAEWYYGPQKWMMNNLGITYKKGNTLFDEANLSLAHQFFEESRYDRDFNDPILRSRIEKLMAYSANWDARKSLGSSTKLYYGLEAVLNDVESEGKDKNIWTDEYFKAPSRYPKAQWSSYAAYFSLQHDLTEKLLLQAGGRYNLFSMRADFSNNLDFYPIYQSKSKLQDAALTGSLGLLYNASESWSISGNLSTAFRAPNVDDMGKIFDSEPGKIIVPNKDLTAEYAYNAEIGMSKVIKNTLKVDLTAYYTLLKDAMVRRNFQLNGHDSITYNGDLSQVQAIQNAAMTNVYGLQLGLELKLPYNFNFSSNINYQKGEEEMDDGSSSPTRHAPPLFGISKLSYEKAKLKIQFYLMYSTERSFEDMPLEERGKTYMYASDSNGNPYSPSWYTINLKAMKQLNKTFTFSLGIENISDQRYRPYSSGIVAPARNFIFSLRATF